MRFFWICLLLLHVVAAQERDCDSASSDSQCGANDTVRQDASMNVAGEDMQEAVNVVGEDEYDEDAEYFDMGVPQRMDRVDFDDFQQVMADAFIHLTEAAVIPELNDAFFACKNKSKLCVEWALDGRCNSMNAKELRMMDTICCPVCESVEQLDFLTRCPMDPNAYTAYAKPGDVNRHFMKSLETIDPKYEPKVLSAPSYLPGDNHATADYKVGGPWIVTMENFVTEEEAQRLIDWGNELGYERSTDNGPNIVDDRTSHETFCTDGCFEDDMVKGIMKRIVEVTGIPEEHSDYLQLLQYSEGQFYGVHQDYHPHQPFSATGARILTFYIYLNTVEDGGETHFPAIDLSITPRRGRVAMWSNVLNSDPEEEDWKARHEALPVGEGEEKYGATAWFHHRDYRNNQFLNGRECDR